MSPEQEGTEPGEYGKSPKISRRRTLKKGARWLGGIIALTILYPLLKFVGFSIPRKPQKIRVERDILPGGFYLGANFVVFADKGGKVWALSRRCTHLGCLVSYNETQKRLICPCHQSVFSRHGKRLAGPAKLNLPSYKISRAGAGRSGYVVIIS
jgi:nitrite reductase/ring-hydroxylating ferredoxin subunit